LNKKKEEGKEHLRGGKKVALSPESIFSKGKRREGGEGGTKQNRKWETGWHWEKKGGCGKRKTWSIKTLRGGVGTVD